MFYERRPQHYKRQKKPVYLTIYPQFEEGRWIHAFPKVVGVKWNVDSFVQDLNSGHDMLGFLGLKPLQSTYKKLTKLSEC